jgi:hypothetical protein
MLKLPFFKRGIVSIGLGLLEQMPNTPTNAVAIAHINTALGFFMRFGQDIGNGAAKTWFFGYI